VITAAPSKEHLFPKAHRLLSFSGYIIHDIDDTEQEIINLKTTYVEHNGKRKQRQLNGKQRIGGN